MVGEQGSKVSRYISWMYLVWDSADCDGCPLGVIVPASGVYGL